MCCSIAIHTDCLDAARKKGDYRCPSCRKSVYDMEQVWREIRLSVRQQPLPFHMFPPKVGDTFRSTYGLFKIESIEDVPVLSAGEPTGQSSHMFKGSLIEWTLSDGSQPTATLQESAISTLNERVMAAWCNDCESKGQSVFHFLGLECVRCGGFNTSKA